MDTTIYNKLIAFISSQLDVDADTLNTDTRLDADLDIYGEDAFDFLASYSQTFGVDITNFDFGLHFRPDGDVILPSIVAMLGIKKKQTYNDLRILDLYNASVSKKLD
ncbi:MAG: hypothetical protein RL662_1847 [Bacteroidota bacterium]|jgi:acyl carrier protein